MSASRAVLSESGSRAVLHTNFSSVFASVWLRFTSLAILGLVFSLLLYLGRSRIQGWTFYLSGPEVLFEVGVRLVLAALVGIVVGTVLALLAAPFLTGRSRVPRADLVIKYSVVPVAFFVTRFALTSLIRWSYIWGDHKSIFDSILLIGHLLAFTVALLVPRVRKEILTSLDFFIGPRMTRAIVIAAITIAAVLALAELVLSKPPRSVKAATPHPRGNIVLISFDALSAEDVSFYGYRLPTTPNIDALARTSTVFDHFYSACTFTTPAVATLMTGVYPSESHIQQLEGKARPEQAGKNLPQLMREGGYATGSVVSNPFAYYYVKSLDGFEVLPEPQFGKGIQAMLWKLTAPFHQNWGIGSRVDEYMDLEIAISALKGESNRRSLRFRPATSFQQARQVLSQLPDGFFLWVHVLAPHDPYLPDVADRNRFLPDSELETFVSVSDERRFQPLYAPSQQSLIDRRRLAYDEYVASADREFGSFLEGLERSGKLQNTTVIVTADHGESFEGGVYRHETPYLTLPVIHVPLIVHAPGQQTGERVEVTADQTSLAPTILDLAGLHKPQWMHGESLVEWLNHDRQGAHEGQAFTEFLEKNSIFRPLRQGSVGMIDAQYEYVLDLATQKGELRPLNQAQYWKLDRTSDAPSKAQAMRAAILARFPELHQPLK